MVKKNLVKYTLNILENGNGKTDRTHLHLYRYDTWRGWEMNEFLKEKNKPLPPFSPRGPHRHWFLLQKAKKL